MLYNGSRRLDHRGSRRSSATSKARLISKSSSRSIVDYFPPQLTTTISGGQRKQAGCPLRCRELTAFFPGAIFAIVGS